MTQFNFSARAYYRIPKHPQAAGCGSWSNSGIITLGDVRGAEPSTASSLSVWEINDPLAHLKVSEIMTHNPAAIQQTASIGDAAKIMLERKFSSLPVVDDADHLVGIVTESDIFCLSKNDHRNA